MTEQEKQLLLKDLCARLPYGVKIHIKGEYHQAHNLEEIDIANGLIRFFENMHLCEYKINSCKPYLRPMSSMTEDEKEEYTKVIESLLWTNELDFLNKYHFDYRGLIPMNLALEASEGIYEIDK